MTDIQSIAHKIRNDPGLLDAFIHGKARQLTKWEQKEVIDDASQAELDYYREHGEFP